MFHAKLVSAIIVSFHLIRTRNAHLKPMTEYQQCGGKTFRFSLFFDLVCCLLLDGKINFRADRFDVVAFFHSFSLPLVMVTSCSAKEGIHTHTDLGRAREQWASERISWVVSNVLERCWISFRCWVHRAQQFQECRSKRANILNMYTLTHDPCAERVVWLYFFQMTTQRIWHVSLSGVHVPSKRNRGNRQEIYRSAIYLACNSHPSNNFFFSLLSFCLFGFFFLFGDTF